MPIRLDLPPLDTARRDMFADVYRFRQKYSDPEPTEEFWDACANEMSEICLRHNNHPLIVDLLIAVYGDIERVMTERPTVDERSGNAKPDRPARTD